MVQYICPRCNYTTKQRSDIRKHFKRKRPCIIVNEDISLEECYIKILGVVTKNESKMNPKSQKVTKNESKMNPNESKMNPKGKKVVKSESKMNPNGFTYDFFDSDSLRNPNKKVVNNISDNSTLLMQKKYKCPKCKKVYSTNSNLHKHMKSCTEEDIRTYSKEELDYLLEKRLEQQQKLFLDKLEDKEKMIFELTRQVEKLIDKVGNTTYNTYNIMIKPFGKEDTSYISGDYIRNLINSGPYNSIPKLLKYIHFNPNHKENHNIKIPNKKQPFAEIFNGNDWEYRDKKTTIEDMSERAFTLLNEHYRGGNDYMNKFKSEFEDSDSNVSKKVNKSLELMIINSQKHIKVN